MKKNICLIIALFISMSFNGCNNSGNDPIIPPIIPSDSFQITLTTIGTAFVWSVLADVRYTCQSNVTMRVEINWGDGSRNANVVFAVPAATNGVIVEDLSKLGAVNYYPPLVGKHTYTVTATFTPEGSNVSPIVATAEVTTIWNI